MGFLDSLKKGMGAEDVAPRDTNTLDEMMRTSNSPDAGRARVIVVEPIKMEECNALVECIRHGLVVVINSENTEPDLSRRIIDFLTGATRAIDGRNLKINATTHIFAPADIEIATRRKEKKVETSEEAVEAPTPKAAPVQKPAEPVVAKTEAPRAEPVTAKTQPVAAKPEVMAKTTEVAKSMEPAAPTSVSTPAAKVEPTPSIVEKRPEAPKAVKRDAVDDMLDELGHVTDDDTVVFNRSDLNL